MSTLSVTSIQTGNGTTDFTVSTGNTSSGKITMPASGGITIQSNAVINVFTSTVSGNIGIGVSNVITITSGGNTTFSNNTTFSGNTTFSNIATFSGANTVISSNLSITGNVVSTTTFAANVTLSGPLTNVASNTGFNLGTSTKAANGYTWLPNGLLMQWFTAPISNGAQSTVAFPVAYSTNCYSLTMTMADAAAPVRYRATIANGTNFTANSDGNTNNRNFYFLAIGV